MLTSRRLTAFLLLALMSVAPSLANGTLDQYLKPAEITRLDWLLLGIQVGSFSQPVRWDSSGVISSVSLYAARGGKKIGMTFVIDEKAANTMSPLALGRVFRDTVESVSGIIKVTIPETDVESNVYANFIGKELIAEYEAGMLRFSENWREPQSNRPR